MTEFKGTPGPWAARRAVHPDNTGGYDWAIIAPDKAIIAECFQVVDWAEKGVSYDFRPVEANARLIASAPALLEALQEMEARFGHVACLQVGKARAAIASALGADK